MQILAEWWLNLDRQLPSLTPNLGQGSSRSGCQLPVKLMAYPYLTSVKGNTSIVRRTPSIAGNILLTGSRQPFH